MFKFGVVWLLWEKRVIQMMLIFLWTITSFHEKDGARSCGEPEKLIRRQAQASRNSIRKPQHIYDASMTVVRSEGPVNNTEKSSMEKSQQFDLIDDSSISTPKSPSQSVAESFEGMVNNTDGVVFDAHLDSEMQTLVKAG